jgi:DNA-binding YbaB/EbfC family protein
MSDLPDMNDILRQAMAMQEQLMAAQEEANERTVEGRAGGGLVRITMTGGGDPTAVHIAPEAIDPDNPELLEDLVLAALRDALHAMRELQTSAVGGLDLGALDLGSLDFGGLDLGALGLDGPEPSGPRELGGPSGPQ